MSSVKLAMVRVRAEIRINGDIVANRIDVTRETWEAADGAIQSYIIKGAVDAVTHTVFEKYGVKLETATVFRPEFYELDLGDDKD